MKMPRVLICLAALAMLAGCALEPRRHHSSDVVVRVAPPPAPVRVTPAMRPGYIWAPGYWRWNGNRHVWVDGGWLRERRGWYWVPAHWEARRGGWLFASGHWQR